MGPIATNASLQLIYNQLRSVGRYHPFTAETFADWATEAGDIVEVSRDGVGYASPLHATTLRWNGKQQMEMEANGQKERDSVARMSARAFNSGAGGGAGYRSSARAKREVMNEIADEEARTSTRFTQTGNMLSMAVGTTSVTGKDIISYASRDKFPDEGNPDKVYKANDTGAYYIWRGGQYIRVTLDTDGNNAYWIKAGDIAISINEDGSTDGRINADRVYLGRITQSLKDWADTTDGVIAEKITAAQVRTMKLTANEIQSFLANIGTANLSALKVTGNITAAGAVYGSGIYIGTEAPYKDLSKAIEGAQIVTEGTNGYKLQVKPLGGTWTDAGSFSRAVASWTMGWSNGTFSVKANPQNQSVSTQIVQGTPVWDGSAYTIPIQAIDSDNPNYQYDTGREVYFTPTAAMSEARGEYSPRFFNRESIYEVGTPHVPRKVTGTNLGGARYFKQDDVAPIGKAVVPVYSTYRKFGTPHTPVQRAGYKLGKKVPGQIIYAWDHQGNLIGYGLFLDGYAKSTVYEVGEFYNYFDVGTASTLYESGDEESYYKVDSGSTLYEAGATQHLYRMLDDADGATNTYYIAGSTYEYYDVGAGTTLFEAAAAETVYKMVDRTDVWTNIYYFHE